MDRSRTIQTEDGTILQEYQLRNVLPGDALRAVNFARQTLRIAKRRGQEEPPDQEDLDAWTAFDERQAATMDRVTGAEGYLVGHLVEGLDLPDAETPWKQGLAMVRQLVNDGWRAAEISAAYVDCLQYATTISLGIETAHKVVAVANFSHPPTDSTTAS